MACIFSLSKYLTNNILQKCIKVVLYTYLSTGFKHTTIMPVNNEPIPIYYIRAISSQVRLSLKKYSWIKPHIELPHRFNSRESLFSL